MAKYPPKTIEEYILAFPDTTQERLREIWAIIVKNAPEAEASISYAIPTFKLKGKPLVYFAGFKNHIGFYALPTGHKAFEKEFSVYKTGKGSVQFPLDKELPTDLILKVVEFRINEVLEKQNLNE
ncbi:uncharacterized protein YdhG (YjbR/CyaY superfamily) [Flavobacterium arsenatis]|uniref:Uncharacterized protein YdhG (YjbR/CyaY superfamily) n=1 Tax=Flavobacterium arsenatis TaxID=1484332 RepID=A0ABU1TPF3_9FLAO|nr:DUF1801 domain-containing protein [Flavobacterium arsenatis]MDR6967814.1 uncharacterized protein YdhG (YjbR/CyaY superfamily) [Flavobacterium arsenatis]